LECNFETLYDAGVKLVLGWAQCYSKFCSWTQSRANHWIDYPKI